MNANTRVQELPWVDMKGVDILLVTMREREKMWISLVRKM